MRTSFLALVFIVALADAATGADFKPDHPGAVALGQDNGKWGYKSFPELMPLYVFEGDERGKSNCDSVCAAVWPIVRAPDNALPTGDWTIIQRDDGRTQWAYKGMPAYTFYDDEPYHPKGEGLPFGWWQDEAVAGATPAAGVYMKFKMSAAPPAQTWRILEP